jgi:hypothetical protein
MISILNADYVGSYMLRLSFNDGRTGTVDLRDVICDDPRGIFAPLRDLDRFRQFKVEFDTVCWPENLDLAPEYLYFRAFKDLPELKERFKQWGYANSLQ